MTGKRLLRRAIADLEDATAPERPPEMFIAWGRGAGCAAGEVAAAWDRVVAATEGNRAPIATAWPWSLMGRDLFPAAEGEGQQ